MKEKISKILVGIDGSRSSMNALYYGIIISEKFNSKLYVAHFAYPIDVKKAKKNINRWFKKIPIYINKIPNSKVDYSTDLVISPSPIIDSILDYVKKNKIDHIIVGSSRKSGVRKLLLGSTSSGIVNSSNCIVTVVK
ncbi:MAG: universal stress protein [Nitrososphaeraceae archaeon]